MANITVDVDIDLDEFELHELLDELENRCDSARYRASKDNRKEIIDFIRDMELFKKTSTRKISLVDSMKMDFLANNLSKISINDLENLLK